MSLHPARKADGCGITAAMIARSISGGGFDGEVVFVVYSSDGRTYTLTVTKADMAEIAKASL